MLRINWKLLFPSILLLLSLLAGCGASTSSGSNDADLPTEVNLVQDTSPNAQTEDSYSDTEEKGNEDDEKLDDAVEEVVENAKDNSVVLNTENKNTNSTQDNQGKEANQSDENNQASQSASTESPKDQQDSAEASAEATTNQADPNFPDIFPDIMGTTRDGENVIIQPQVLGVEDDYMLFMISDESCIYCRMAMPDIERYQKEYAVSIVIGWKGNYRRNLEFMKEYESIHKHLIFDQGEITKAGMLYVGTPQYFLVDNNSNLVFVWAGYNTSREVQRIEEALQEYVGYRQ